MSPSIEVSKTLNCMDDPMKVLCIQGNVIDRTEKSGANGKGYQEDISYTINTSDRHAVCYGIDRASFNQGQNALYNFAVEEELAQTIVAKGAGGVMTKK